jgi:hypothetical protein
MTDHQNVKVRFDELRKLVMTALDDMFEDDYCGKSYEGAFNWITCYPNYYEDPKGKLAPNRYILELHCYLLGPARHYSWEGKTRSEALEKAEKEIKSWLHEEWLERYEHERKTD